MKLKHLFLTEGIEDEHGLMVQKFEDVMHKMSKEDRREFENLMKIFDQGYEDDDDNQMEGAMDDMEEILNKY